jgi:hypothetical protein
MKINARRWYRSSDDSKNSTAPICSLLASSAFPPKIIRSFKSFHDTKLFVIPKIPPHYSFPGDTRFFLSSSPPAPISHGIEFDALSASGADCQTQSDLHVHSFNTTGIDPGLQIAALRNVEVFELRAAIDNGFDTCTRHSNTSSHAKRLEVQKMKTNRTQGAVGYCRSAESEVEMS